MTRSRAFKINLPHFHKPRNLLQVVVWLTTAIFSVLAAGFVASFLVVTIVSKDLPSPNKLITRQVDQSTKIMDRNGKLLYEVYGNTNRTLVTLDKISPYLIQATLATEDAQFYEHGGFSPKGFVRGIYLCVTRQGCAGGSTLTQQLVRNSLISNERTIFRKIREFILAMQIEKVYSKDEILQMYFNEAPYGGQAVGVEAASEMYFGKKASDLTLAEGAMMAGLPQAPSYYSPFGVHPEYTKGRQTYVLHLMRDVGWVDKSGQNHKIAAEIIEAAKNETLVYNDTGGKIEAAHFVMYVKKLLTDRFGEQMVASGGLQVTTTLDLDKQNILQKTITDQVTLDEKQYGYSNGAGVLEDPKTGEILAMVGSRNYFDKNYDGKYNVTIASRQPGSAIKPINYATALKQGYTAATVLYDVQTQFTGASASEPYIPVNYDGKFRGPIQLRYALANSLNIPAVKVLKLVGLENMIKTASDMGIDTFSDPSRYGLSLTLGGGETNLLELTGAYATFANTGTFNTPVFILKVTDSKGSSLYNTPTSSGRKVLDSGIAYIISDILADNDARSMEFGTGSTLHIPGYTVSVKTGTTNDLKDNWTVGYTPDLTLGIWVGNNDNTQMKNVASGISGASYIWNKAIKEYLKDKKDVPFVKPDNVVQVKIDAQTGGAATGDFPSRLEYFLKGTEPTSESQMRRRLTICKVDGKIASQSCIDAKKTEEKTFLFLIAELPEWQDAVDKWINDNHKDDEMYHPPHDISTAYFDSSGEAAKNGGPLVAITAPALNTKVKSGDSVTIQADVSSPYAVTKVTFSYDGSVVGAPVTSIPYKKNIQIASTETSGQHQIKVTAEDSAGNDGSATLSIQVV
ncbi:MAG: PBP1A family penicillin-binding protein [candidate division WWE3 bacterium]|nr:PBP1A family penicillin-binding protein [candidate division WWE3 bacterium]